MPKLDQVPRRKTGALEVVKGHGVQASGIHRAPCHHQRQAFGLRCQDFVRHGAGEHNHAIHAPGHQLRQAGLLITGTPMSADKQRGVTSIGQGAFNPLQALAIKRTVNGLCDDPNGAGLAARQTLGHRVGAKVQRSDGAFDGFLFRFTDGGRAVENARHGARRDAGLLGHHVKGGRTLLMALCSRHQGNPFLQVKRIECIG